MTAESASETDPELLPEPRPDASAWLEQYGDALFRYARARVGEHELAEDLVQETLLGALQSQDRFQNRSSVRTWLFSILRRTIVDHYRRGEANRPEVRPDKITAAGSLRERSFTSDGFWRNAPSPWKTPEELFQDNEFWHVLDGCLGHLPRSLAQAFVLRELEQTEIQELCQILGLNPGNLRVRLHRARLLLRDCLERKWFGSRSGEAPRKA